MATHSSILAWRIPWTEELAGCSSWGCRELDTTERLSTHTHTLTDEETGLERVRSHLRSLGNYVIELGLSLDILDSRLIPSS